MSDTQPFHCIVRTNITGLKDYDIICFHSAVSWNAFKEYVTDMKIEYEILDERKAARLLVSQGGIGFGCYTMRGANPFDDREREYRRALAKARKSIIATITGVASVATPVELWEAPQVMPLAQMLGSSL